MVAALEGLGLLKFDEEPPVAHRVWPQAGLTPWRRWGPQGRQSLVGDGDGRAKEVPNLPKWADVVMGAGPPLRAVFEAVGDRSGATRLAVDTV